MKSKILILFTAGSLLLPGLRAPAQDGAGAAKAATQDAVKDTAKDDLKALVMKVQAKLKDGKKTEADLKDELAEFDTLLAKYKGEKTDSVAQILMMKAMLYTQVLDNDEKGTELLKQVKTDFPDTMVAKNVDKILASMEQQAGAKKIQAGLAVGTKFPDFDEKDVAGKPFSVANYKGKVVMVDFWATWCGPCVGELPNVLKTYEKHHPEGFEIVGISLDKDQEKLTSFTKEKNMPWQQYFDGLVWQNKLAVKYGVNSIPATYLIDGDGNIIAKNLRGEELEAAVAKAVTKKL
jgi:peroxiredoxin